MTPAGIQQRASLRRRRRLVLGLNLASCLLFIGLTASVLGTDGWTFVELGLLISCVLSIPWTILGFWNAVIGFWLLRRGGAGLQSAAPFLAAAEDGEPIHVRTAVVMTLRNEDPARALPRLERVKRSLDASGWGEAFAYHVLSDSDDPAVIAAEEQAVADWRLRSPILDQSRIAYRRRPDNAGFKAGNLQEFCGRHAETYDLMLPLDADSAMDGPSVLRLVKIMQAHPRIGILQSLVVGTPAGSPFSRIFQFGMRQGMRLYTLGAAWWTGDCGPFWGHNALVRIQPFAEHCRMPNLSDGLLGGPILSHDQIEAVLMRRAGFEVRVLPVESGSFEDNPPTLIDHVAREARWCFGNMQYLRLLTLPGLHPISRFQLFAAVAMFLTAPAITLALALLPFKLAAGGDDVPASLVAGLYVAWLLAAIAPKLAGYLDLLLDPAARRAYGGAGKILAGAGLEIAFSFLLLAVATFRLTLLFLSGFGRNAGSWNRQNRDARGISFRSAASGLWGCLAFGCAVWLALVWSSPAILVWSLPLTLGYLLAIPFAMATASPRLGLAIARRGICATPEELSAARPAAEAR